MPTYEYACSNCGELWEEVQRITADPTTECPKCHKASAQRQISGGSFILKGGGWYADAYSSAKPAAKSESKSEGDAASKGDAKPDAKAEAKPEKKAETKETKESTPAPAATPSATKT